MRGKENEFSKASGPTHCDPEEGPRLSTVAFLAKALGMTACLRLDSQGSFQSTSNCLVLLFRQGDRFISLFCCGNRLA